MRSLYLKAKRYFDLLFRGYVGTRDMLLDWLSLPFKLLSSISIRYKIAATITLILALTVCSLGYMTFTHQTRMLREEMQNRAEVLVQQLATAGKEGILTKQELQVYSTINEFQKKPDMVYAMILDANGSVFIHNVLSMKGKVLLSDRELRSTEALVFQEALYEGKPVLDATFPIMFKPKNIRIGFAKIGLSEESLHAAIKEQKKLFVWMSLSFIGVGLLLSFGLARLLTKSICTLEEGMRLVTQGDLRREIRISDKDEIGRLAQAFNQMILSLREKLHMEKYLSRSTVRSIKKNRDLSQLKLGGAKKHVTTFFSDVRGFTAISERMKPEDIVKMLNIYLNLQSKVVRQWGGVVDKFIGDEVMAIFEGPDSEINAVRAAVEIQRYCESLNQARCLFGETQLQIGIGLNSGEVVMGNMGSTDQMDYTIIGDTVNIASRLCTIAQPTHIIISDAVAKQLGENIIVSRIDSVFLKGKDEPIEIFNVVNVKGSKRSYMRQAIDAPCKYHLAVVPYDSGSGIIKNISPSGCLMETGSALKVGTKITLEIDHKAFRRTKLSALVTHAREHAAKNYVGLRFNDIEEQTRCRIITWIHEVESDVVDTTGPLKPQNSFQDAKGAACRADA